MENRSDQDLKVGEVGGGKSHYGIGALGGGVKGLY